MGTKTRLNRLPVVMVFVSVQERRQLVWAWVYTRIVVVGTDVFTLLIATAVLFDWPYVVYGIMLIPIYAAFIVIVRSYALQVSYMKKKKKLSLII